VLGQLNDRGEMVRSRLPEGLTPVSPGQEAEARRLGQEQGKTKAKKPEEMRQGRLKLRNMDTQFGTVSEEIRNAIKMVEDQGNIPETGAIGELRSNLPFQYDARKLARMLDTIRANIGFDKLQAMRDASPTGGALGQVSEFENRLLQATSGALDQGGDDKFLADNLKRILKNWEGLNKAYHQEFEEQFGAPSPGGDAGGDGGGGAPPPPGAKRGVDDNYYIPDPDRPGKYLRWEG
jgi:hypothetical protein